MAFPTVDYMGLQKTDLLDICYQGANFTILAIANGGMAHAKCITKEAFEELKN